MISAMDDFDAFVRARTPALLRTAFLLTGDQHRAEDLVQDALIRTHRAWARLRESNPDAYTRKVMYHLNISWWRRGGTSELPTDHIPDRGAPSRSDETISKIALRTALAQLTSRQRAVIVLRFFEDVTEAEAADLLGVTVGTIKSQTSKALARLRTLAPALLDAEAVGRSVYVSNVDLRDKVLQGSRRITVRNRVVGSVAAALVLVGAVVTFGLLRNGKEVVPPVESPSPSQSTSPSPSTAPPVNVSELRNGTVVLPAFPGGWALNCPAGSYTFKDGSMFVPNTDYSIHMGTDPIEGDLDGLPGNEVLVAMNCDDGLMNSASNLLGLKASGSGGWSSLGYVFPAGLVIDGGEGIKVDHLQVVVHALYGCTGSPCATSAMDKQERRYALDGGTFKQVSGPTTFPPLEQNIRKIDFQNFTFPTVFSILGQPGLSAGGAFRVVNGTGQANLARSRATGTGPNTTTVKEGTDAYTVVVKQVVYVKTDDWNVEGAAAVLMDISGPDGTFQVVFHFSKHLEGYQSPVSHGYVQVRTGMDGITAISKIQGGDVVTVTVQTSSGQQNWKYTIVGNMWTKV